ncbi:MAG: sensor histidine kinase [Flavobacteriia bacterium]|nr:sensor histidine kinase [Flavobacteriia bacterium]
MIRDNDDYIQERTNSILDVIMSFARLEFNVQTEISSNHDVFDAIAAGVNMLGEELENSVVTIKEKESLLKEVHHRVKNNLQIIASLMNLQAASSTDPVFLELIRECKNRIDSMSIIHEMLYQSKDLSKINATVYIKHLILGLESSFYMSNVNVDFLVTIDQTIILEADRMIPMGLILNEAISNSYKYAFPDREGIIEIDFNIEDGYYLLRIKDNGIGLPADYDVHKNSSLGLQLIVTLAEQLDAELLWLREEGLGFEFRFK